MLLRHDFLLGLIFLSIDVDIVNNTLLLIFILIWAQDSHTFLLLMSLWVLALLNLTMFPKTLWPFFSSPSVPSASGSLSTRKASATNLQMTFKLKKSLTLAFYPFSNSTFQLFYKPFPLTSSNSTVVRGAYYCFHLLSLCPFPCLPNFSHF